MDHSTVCHTESSFPGSQQPGKVYVNPNFKKQTSSGSSLASTSSSGSEKENKSSTHPVRLVVKPGKKQTITSPSTKTAKMTSAAATTSWCGHHHKIGKILEFFWLLTSFGLKVFENVKKSPTETEYIIRLLLEVFPPLLPTQVGETSSFPKIP